MRQNTLTVMDKALCNKKVNIYNPGQLQRVEFIYNYGKNDIKAKYFTHNYNINVVSINGQVINIFSISSKNQEFTTEEINYFLYFINNHIQNNMRA